jgi:putative spermidine/putrescine transport system substrate-binding protein
MTPAQSRRQFLAGSLAGLGAVAAADLVRPQPASAQAPLVVTTYGGVWEKGIRESYIPCFEKKTGGRATPMLGAPAEWMAKVRANPQTPPIHILMNSELFAIEAIEQGLVDEIPLDRVPNLKAITQEALYEQYQKRGAMTHFASCVLVYNKKRIARPPETWEEFFENTARGTYGRTVSVPGSAYPWTLSILLWNIARTYGDDIKKMDTTFAKLRAMQKNIVKFWTNPAEFQNLFETNEANLGIYWDGRAWGWRDAGNQDWLDYYIPKPKGVMAGIIVQKVKNAPDAAWDYLNCTLDPEAQFAFGKLVRYSMTHPKAPLTEELRRGLTKWEQVEVPPTDLIKYRSAWVERWNKEIGA